MSEALEKIPYVVTMYADRAKTKPCYQIPIGVLTDWQHQRFLFKCNFDGVERPFTCNCKQGVYVVETDVVYKHKVTEGSVNPDFALPDTFISDEEIRQMEIPDVYTFVKSPGCETHRSVWDFLKTRTVHITFKTSKRKILLDKLDRYINAMRAWNLVLTDQKYVAGENLIVEERRKKIVLDGLWFQQIAADIRATHQSPGMEQLDESPTEEQAPTETDQQKKERLACELWNEGLTKSKIAKRLKELCNLKETDYAGLRGGFFACHLGTGLA